MNTEMRSHNRKKRRTTEIWFEWCKGHVSNSRLAGQIHQVILCDLRELPRCMTVLTQFSQFVCITFGEPSENRSAPSHNKCISGCSGSDSESGNGSYRHSGDDSNGGSDYGLSSD